VVQGKVFKEGNLGWGKGRREPLENFWHQSANSCDKGGKRLSEKVWEGGVGPDDMSEGVVCGQVGRGKRELGSHKKRRRMKSGGGLKRVMELGSAKQWVLPTLKGRRGGKPKIT